ncbi:MAG: glycosyltransferase [Ruminococcus flavefaciens]|nr:glycosyltransferase [Ruminococcus flavefaciens]
MDRPMVSVAITTYNHEQYIGTAIESVLMQKTNFKYELLIADDASTDQTPLIIDRYRKLYPETITVYHRKNNMGATKNGNVLHDTCQGKYIAVLDGDDYWSYDLKLQRQVDYLEQHKKAVAAAHNVLCIDQDGNPLPEELVDFPYQKEHKYGRQDALNCMEFGHTSGLVFRNFHDIMTPEQLKVCRKSTLNNDYKYGITLGMLGYIYYFEDTWSCRRKVFEGDSWTAKAANMNLTKFVCSNYFKTQQYLEAVFNQKIDISNHLAYLLKEKLVSVRGKMNKENIEDLNILFVSYIWALRRKRKQIRKEWIE